MTSFVFEEHHTFDWPVMVPVPTDGTIELHEFTGKFKQLPDDELFELDADESGETALEIEIARVRRVLIGWTGIKSAKGEDVAFSEKALGKMLKYGPFRRAVIEAYFDATLRGGAHRKN